MILTINCIIDKVARKNFDVNVIPKLQKLTKNKIKNIHISELNNSIDYSIYSHLLLSGSELSASKQNEWDDELYFVTKSFINENKNVLGICYGHQMIAKTLLGQKACRRAEIPEFGWKSLDLQDNKLFSGITNFKVVQSHYDEVCELTDDFTILAANKECGVQAFQYKNLNVWGIQFHPEMDWESGSKMLNQNLITEECAKKLYVNDVKDPKEVEQNIIIFDNFFNNI